MCPLVSFVSCSYFSEPTCLLCVSPFSGLPNEGTPEWLDSFLEKNRSHVEISDRKLVEWALKSGLSQRRGGGDDRKESGLGIRELDDHSVQWMINSIAPLLSRNFVVMESGNLTVEGREATLQRYGSDFKRKAVVVMGEPPEDHKSWVDNGLLEKKRKIESEGQRGSEKVEEKTADGEKDVEMTIDQAPELTEEERNQAWFRKKETPDMSSKEMASYSSFTLPGAELFDEVDYVWQPEEKSREYLREWILEKKRMQRVEDLQPSEWFRKKWNEWGTSLTHWKNTEMEFSRNKPKRKEKREKKAQVKSEAPKEIEPKDVVKELGGVLPRSFISSLSVFHQLQNFSVFTLGPGLSDESGWELDEIPLAATQGACDKVHGWTLHRVAGSAGMSAVCDWLLGFAFQSYAIEVLRLGTATREQKLQPSTPKSVRRFRLRTAFGRLWQSSDTRTNGWQSCCRKHPDSQEAHDRTKSQSSKIN